MFSFSFFSPAPNLVNKDASNDDLLVSTNENNSSLSRFSSILGSPLLSNNFSSKVTDGSDVLPPSPIQSSQSPSPSPSPSYSSQSSPSLSSSSLSLSSSTAPIQTTTTTQSSDPISPTNTSSSSSEPITTPFTTLSTTSIATTPATTPVSTPTSPVSDFAKFAEKKKNQSERQNKTLRSILRSTAVRFGLRDRDRGSSTSSSQSSLTTVRPKSKNFFRFESISSAYSDIYSSIGSVVPSWAGGSGTNDSNIDEGPLEDIQRQVNKIAEQLNEMKTGEQMSSIVHEFYQAMISRFEGHPSFKDIVQVSVDQLIDYTEIRLLSTTWNTIFNQILIEDEEKDLKLQNQIRSLNWIMADHLELDLDLTKPEICDHMDKAVGYIIEMGSKGIPLQKLECIVNCSKSLIQLLTSCRDGEPISADLFLPALVYTVVHANPPLLHSNIRFINEFSSPHRLTSGEASYYFTNLCCAVAFIEKLNGESLNLSEEQFKRYINGGERPSGGYSDQFNYNSANNRASEALRRMNHNNSLIASLSSKQSALENEIDQLKRTIMDQQESLLAAIESISKLAPSNDRSNEMRKIAYKSRLTQGPFYHELNTTS